MRKKQINLFSIYKKDRPSLMRYLAWFSTIDDIYTDKELNKRYPPSLSKDVSSIFAKGQFIMVSSQEEFEQLRSPVTSSFFFCVKVYTKSLSVLKHLRNAIAHDYISYDSKKKRFKLEDYSKKGQTANSEIGEEQFWSLINLILERSGIENK